MPWSYVSSWSLAPTCSLCLEWELLAETFFACSGSCCISWYPLIHCSSLYLGVCDSRLLGSAGGNKVNS